MSSSIPRTTEDPDKRKFRLLAEEVERLRDKVHSLEKQAKEPPVPSGHEDIPNSVQAAFSYINRFQDAYRPMRAANRFGEEEIVEVREPTGHEMEVLAEATEVLADYFRKHNTSKRKPKRRRKK